MSAQILDGKAVALAVRERVAEGVRELIASGGPQPGLATVLGGADPASQIYVKRKNEQTAEAGMRSFHHELDAATPQTELEALILVSAPKHTADNLQQVVRRMSA